MLPVRGECERLLVSTDLLCHACVENSYLKAEAKAYSKLHVFCVSANMVQILCLAAGCLMLLSLQVL